MQSNNIEMRVFCVTSNHRIFTISCGGVDVLNCSFDEVKNFGGFDGLWFKGDLVYSPPIGFFDQFRAFFQAAGDLV